MKTCKKCQESKSLESFHKHKGFKDGRRSVCKECSCANSRLYYEENQEKHRAACKDWQRRNPKKVAAYQKLFRKRQGEVSRRWVINHPQKVKAQKSLNYAVHKGEVQRNDSCQVCGCTNRKVEAHHCDYSKPLEVIWVCPPCHGWIHRKRPKEEVSAA